MTSKTLVMTAFALLAASSSTAHAQSTRPSRSLNEVDLARVCDNKIRGYLDGMFEKAYQYTPEQKERIRTRLLELKPQQIRYTLETYEERVRLGTEMRTYLKNREPGKELPKEYRDLQARLLKLNAGNQVFSEATARDEIERLLPPEQAKKGRERLDDLRKAQVHRVLAADRIYDMPGVKEGSVMTFGEPGGWWRYVDQFRKVFRLDEAQMKSAESALRDAMDRRDRYCQEHQQEISAVASGDPPSDLSADFFSPIEEAWNELKSRLDRIPTDSQIEEVRKKERDAGRLDKIVTTRPTDFISRRPLRPSGSQTQPGIAQTRPSVTSQPSRTDALP